MFMTHRGGFTLVELIVVITIIGILSTIGFVSYSGYIVGARDSNRLGQLANLSEALQVFSSSKRLPLPDAGIDIMVNANIVAFQGDVGVSILDVLDYKNGGSDPKDKTPFTYMISKDRKTFQLGAFMEEPGYVSSSIVPHSYAVNFEDRYFKTYGFKLGILTSAETSGGVFNTPAHQLPGVTQEIDLLLTTDEYIAHISDTEKIQGDGTQLQKANPIHSCKRLKESGIGYQSQIYTINPIGAGDVFVYCDMETAGGGWTLIARSVAGGTLESGESFTWNGNAGILQDLTTPYVLDNVSGLSYEEIMLASYAVKRNIIDTSIVSSSNVSSLSDGSHTLGASGISGPSLSGQGMFFVR